MVVSVSIDAEKVLEVFNSAFGEALRPDVAGPFQDSLIAGLGTIMDWEETRFLEFSEGNGDWPDLAPSTKLRRAYKQGYRRGRHPRGEPTALEKASNMFFPILRDTEALLESVPVGGPDNEIVIEADGVTSQSTIPYGHYHQEGGSIAGRPPQREFIVIPPAEILATVGKQIAAGIGAAIAAAIAEARL